VIFRRVLDSKFENFLDFFPSNEFFPCKSEFTPRVNLTDFDSSAIHSKKNPCNLCSSLNTEPVFSKLNTKSTIF
jgi:hypothetical protein